MKKREGITDTLILFLIFTLTTITTATTSSDGLFEPEPIIQPTIKQTDQIDKQSESCIIKTITWNEKEANIGDIASFRATSTKNCNGPVELQLLEEDIATNQLVETTVIADFTSGTGTGTVNLEEELLEKHFDFWEMDNRLELRIVSSDSTRIPTTGNAISTGNTGSGILSVGKTINKNTPLTPTTQGNGGPTKENAGSSPTITSITPPYSSNKETIWVKIRGSGFNGGSLGTGIILNNDSRTLITNNTAPDIVKFISDSEIHFKAAGLGSQPNTFTIQVVTTTGVSPQRKYTIFPWRLDGLEPFGSDSIGNIGLIEQADINGNGPGWTFTYRDSTDTIQYYLLKNEINNGIITVHAKYNNHTEITPINKGGFLYRDSSNNILQPQNTRTWTPTLSYADINSNTLTLNFNENDGKKNSKTLVIELRGKTLIIDAYSDQDKKQFLNNYAGFSLGDSLDHKVKNLDLNYMMHAPVSIVLSSTDEPQYFYTMYPDQTKTNGQLSQRDNAKCSSNPHSKPCYVQYNYLPRKKSTEVMPTRERFYLTISNNVHDVLMKIRNPVSPHRNLLQNRTHYDIYGGNGYLRYFNKDSIILRWTAQETGPAVIDISHRRENPLQCYWTRITSNRFSEGSEFSVKKNDKILSRVETPGFDYLEKKKTIRTRITKGENLSFIIKAINNLCEHTNISINISIGENIYSFPKQYSKVQGTNGWSYLETINEKEKSLRYDTNFDRWQTNRRASYIGEQGMSPPAKLYFYWAKDYLEYLDNLGIKNLNSLYMRTHKNSWDVTFPGLMPSGFVEGGVEAIKELSKHQKSKKNLFGIYLIHTALSETFPPWDQNYFETYKDQALKNNDGSIALFGYHPSNDIGICEGGADVCGTTPLGLLECPFNGHCHKPSINATHMDLSKTYRSINGKKPFLEIDLLEAEREYDLTILYSDYISAMSPYRFMDFYADDSDSNSIGGLIHHSKLKLNKMKEIINGPVETESTILGWGKGENKNYERWDIFLTGYSDLSTLPPDGSNLTETSLIPDVAHLSINPLSVVHGVGLKTRTFNGNDPNATATLIGGKHFRPDWYRSLFLGYGFANYLSGDTPNTPETELSPIVSEIVKNYYLISGIQPYYRETKAKKILYLSNGTFVDLSQAIKENVDFYNDQILIEYENGFKIYINYHRKNNWTIPETTPKGSITLPPHGFAAWMPGKKVFASTFLKNGGIVDYAQTSEYTFADGRGKKTDFFGEMTSIYTTIKKGSDTIHCESAFGCYKNQIFKKPSNLEVWPKGVIHSKIQKITIKGLHIHDDAKLFYKGNEIMKQFYKVHAGENKITLIHFIEFPSLTKATLEVRNPNNNSEFVALDIGTNDRDQDNVLDSADFCNNTATSHKTRVNLHDGCPLPLNDKSSTTISSDLREAVSLLNFQDFEIGIENAGKIAFKGSKLNLTEFDKKNNRHIPLNFDRHIIMDKNSIYVNSTALPMLNVSSEITFYGTGINNPLIHLNGKYEEDVTLVEYNSKTKDLTVTAPQFSNYTVVEGTCGDNICGFLETKTSCSKDCGGDNNNNNNNNNNNRNSNNLKSIKVNLNDLKPHTIQIKVGQLLFMNVYAKEHAVKAMKIVDNATTLTFVNASKTILSLQGRKYFVDLNGNGTEDIIFNIDTTKKDSYTLNISRIKDPKTTTKDNNQTNNNNQSRKNVKPTGIVDDVSGWVLLLIAIPIVTAIVFFIIYRRYFDR